MSLPVEKKIIVKTTPKASKPLVEIMSYLELCKKGLAHPDNFSYPIKSVYTNNIDLSIYADEDDNGKWAVAPDGWHWKAYSEECFYWFELERI